MRELFALMARFSGIDIADPVKVVSCQQEASGTGQLVQAISKQEHRMQETRVAQQAVKQQLHHEHLREAKSESVALLWNECLTGTQKKTVSH